MNLSTSTSEPRLWRRALRRYAVFVAAFATIIAGGLVVLDPYDTGRFSLFGEHEVADFAPNFTAASLAREPAFDAAILGNSTSELLDPARLTALTGLRFVSLSIYGTGPVEQLAVARWLVRHHQHPGEALKALVIGLDTKWCRGDGRLEQLNPFPFWLYSDSWLTYVTHLVNLKAFEAAEQRVELLLGLTPPVRADGHRKGYEAGRVWDASIPAADFVAGTGGFDPLGSNFAAADQLSDLFREVAPETEVVLLFVPRHHSSLLPPGSEAARDEDACKARYGSLAARRPRTVVVDLLQDGPIAREDRNFWDRVHYRAPIARLIEADIADALRGLASQEPRQAGSVR